MEPCVEFVSDSTHALHPLYTTEMHFLQERKLVFCMDRIPATKYHWFYHKNLNLRHSQYVIVTKYMK